MMYKMNSGIDLTKVVIAMPLMLSMLCSFKV